MWVAGPGWTEYINKDGVDLVIEPDGAIHGVQKWIGCLHYDTYNSHTYGIRPVVALPAGTNITKDGATWRVEGTGGTGGVTSGPTSEPTIITEEGIYKITVTTEDKAGESYSETGNISTSAVDTYIVKIDKTEPVAIITGEATGVTGGLIRYFDANNNLGNGHSNSVTEWVDLAEKNNGTVTNGTFTNAYLELNGTDSWVNMGTTSIVAPNITLEASIKLNEISSTKQYILSNATTSGGIGIYVQNGKISVEAYVDLTKYELKFDEELDVNRIYNISVTYDGSDLKLYFDGVCQKTLAASGTLSAGTKLVLGANSSGNANFANIKAYSVRMYNRALTEAEIKQNLNADRISPEKLVASNSSVTVSIIFNEGIQNFTSSSVTVTNGTKGTVSPVESSRMDDSGLYSEYTLPITGITAGSDLKIQLNNSYSDKAENTGNIPEITRTRDNVGPTVTSITASNIDYTNAGKDYTNNSSITYTIIFSEPTVGFVKEDLVIENGTLTTFTKVSSTEFTAVVTNTETAKQVITIPAGVTTDDSGNLNAVASKEVMIDKTTPIITASVEASSNASAEDGKAVKEQSMTLKVEDKGTTAELTALQSGIKADNSYQYYLSTSATALENGEWKDYDQTGATPFTIGTGLTGTYYLFVKEVKDNVDNVSIANGDVSVLNGYHRFGPYVFDNSKPTISIPESQQTTTNASAEDGKAVTSQSVTITVADRGTAGVKTEAAGVAATDSMFAYYLSTSDTALTGGEWTKYSSGTAFTLGTGKTGTYYLFIKTIKDNLGYESSEFVATTTVDGTTYHMFGPYVFDNANPVITLSPDKNETYERAQSVEAEVSDEGTAGLKATQVKYLWVQGTTTPTDSQVLAGTTFVNADTITKSTGTGNDFYLWAIAKDNVGNTYKTSVGPFYLDNTKPTLGTMTSQIESETTYMLNITGFADTTGTTNQSGVKGYLISTSSTTPTTETAWGTVTATTTYDKWIPHGTDDLELEVPQETTYYIWVIDNAGNISTQYSYTTKIIRYALNETSWYEKFEEVVNAATSGDTIRLLKSGTDNTGGTIDKNIIFNTDDKGLTRNVPITVNSGYTLEIQGGETGRITGNSTTQSTIIANGNFKLSGGTIESMAHSGIEATGTATITMTGGKVSSSVDTKGAITNRGTGAITISGGTIGNYSNYIAISNLSSGNIAISGCTVNGSIYTGTGTIELKSGATINGQVYGGSREAAVATSNIVLKGATVNGNIYGGNPEYNVTTSNITLTSGGVGLNVYGGALNGKNVTTSNIKLQGASVSGNIYGGADTLGNVTTANITASSGGVSYIYGGSSQGGTTTNANITIQGSASISRDIYGGSEKAAFATSSNKGNITINIVGGGISGSVYGGSEEAVSYVNNTNINIGKDATGNSSLPINDLIIRGNIYGGGSKADVTTYTTQSVTGTSNIKIDGTGYSTFTLNPHIFGSGEHCAVNTANITIKGIGATGSPHAIKSIQRANTLTIDNANLEIAGILDVDNLNKELAFTLNRIGNLTVKNGTTLHLRRGLNKVEEFNSLDGSGNKATVTIDANGAITASNTTNRIYVYEGINFIIAKEQFVQGEKSSSYGKVSGMTFFGMYTRDRDTRELKYDLYDPTSPTNGNLFKVGSYAEGLYDAAGAITVDGFYTNIMNADQTAIISEYVTVETAPPVYQDWIVGLKTYTKEFTMVAKRNRDRVYQSVELDYLTEAGVTYNVSVFSINSLEPGISLVDKTQIPVMASSGSEANTKFALVMSNGATGWTTEGQTTFYTSATTPIKGTTQYVTDDSGTAPLMDLYLYNSINIDKDTDCGIVEIVFLVEPSTGGQFRLALTINIQTLNEIEDDVDDEMAFQTETRITAGKNYDLFIEEKAYITDRSAMTVSFTIYPLGTFRTGDYRVISSTYQLPAGTKVTMIDYGQAANPKVYYQVINGYDAVESGKYIYRLSNFKLMGATTAYNNPNSAYTTSEYEDYKFIFDFEDATISSDVLRESMQLEIRDGSTNNAKNQQLNTVEFNIYKNKNTTLTLQVTGDESNVYEMVAEGNLKFRIVSGVIRQKIVVDDEDVIINDTYFFDKKLGISVSIYDSSNNRVPYEKIKGTYFAVNGSYYYPDPTGLTRICISQSAATVAKDLNVYIGGGLLETGEYKIRIENFVSDNGTFYGLTAENRRDTTIKIIDLEHGLSAQISDEDRLIDNATGKTFSGTDNIMNIDIKASDIVDNTNIRMKLYRRDATFDGTGTAPTYQAITYTHVNLQNYVSTTLTKPSDEGFTDKSSYEYLVTDEVTENTLIELALNLKTNLTTGGYKLVFELYSGDTSLGKIERHFLITDLVNVP